MNLPNVLDSLKTGDAGCMILHASLSKWEYNITLIPENKMDDFTKLLGEMKSVCEAAATKNPNFR